MKLIVGLGNPGDKYAGNRHNIGFMAVEELARGYGFGPWKKRFQGYAAEGQIGVKKCILLKPATYMNESGRSVREAMRFYKIAVGDVIVVHDELDLKPETIRVKTGGGNAGHNGLKSISAHIGNDYVRVRLGIGHPGDKALVSNYVLQDFAKADRAWLDPLLEGAARGMARLVEGSEAAFLSEAARGRGSSPQAAKSNGAPATETKARTAPEVKPVAVAERLTPDVKPVPVAVVAPPVMNTAPAPAVVPPEVKTVPSETMASPVVEADPFAVIAAAASRPIPAMPAPSIPVIAAREGGGGGAVSTAVMMPEPVRTVAPPTQPAMPENEPEPKPDPEPAPQPEPVIEPEPAPATVTEPLPPLQPPAEKPPLVTAPEPVPAPAMEVLAEKSVSPAAPETAAPKQDDVHREKKRGGLFSSWFKSRVRGGVS